MQATLLVATMAANSAESSPEMQRTTCPHCQKRLKIPPQMLKKTSLKCPKCAQSFSLPNSQPTQPEPELAATLPHRKPPVLAETLPYAPPPETDIEPGLEYLSDYEPAGPGIRILAACGDILAFYAVTIVFSVIVAVVMFISFKFTSYAPMFSFDAYLSVGGFITAFLHMCWNLLLGGQSGFYIDAFIVTVPYFALNIFGLYLMWYCSCKILATPWQATLGKKMFGLIVVDESGQRLTKGKATARWFYRLLGICCFYLGFLGIQKYPHQTWYDRMAKTQVLRRRQEYHA